MLLLYRSAIESIMCNAFTIWFGNVSVKQVTTSKCGNVLIIVMVPLTSLQDIFERSVKKQSIKIIGDPSHILHKNYKLIRVCVCVCFVTL